MVFQLLDDFPSSDTQPSSPISFDLLSLSSFIFTVSFPSSYESDRSSSPLLDTHSKGSFIYSEGDFDGLGDQFLDQWDAQIQTLAIYLVTTCVSKIHTLVNKLGQLDLFLNNFQYTHPDMFQKKLRVLPFVFDRLVELVENHSIFHNNSNIPQHLIPIQVTIFLVHIGHYGNASLPEYVAQWAGVCVRMVIKATYHCFVAFLAFHD
jgi:hypothetical protein